MTKHIHLSLLTLLLLLVAACARPGQPDGGWYDETPPRVVGASPEERATGVKSKKIYINFSEFIKVDNPTQNVVVSPPQLEAPEIKAQGKRISIALMDSLKPNITYTIDFSNAISDNNEGNPLGSYAYTFSTGDHIDTLEVSGYVLAAENLEPIPGILVGLYDNMEDSAFHKLPMLRVSRTDSRGHFTVKGVAPGKYRIYALQDADGDYVFNQKSEMVAFNHDVIEPTWKPDVRQDTTWLDSLHIASIDRVGYTHFLPDDICLRAFTETQTNRTLLKTERTEANRFMIYYTYGHEELPRIEGLNFDATDAFVIDASEHNDTLTYWLRDTALVNQDTLEVALTHYITDTLGVLQQTTDTLTLLSKQPYAKRLKEQQKQIEKWQKEQDRKKKKGLAYDSIMVPEPLALTIKPAGSLDPDNNVTISAAVPLLDVDTAHVRLFAKPENDSIWYPEPYELQRVDGENYLLKASWRMGSEYSLEADSATFQSIYGDVAAAVKQGFKVRTEDEYGTLLFTLTGMEGKNIVGQLMDGSDKVVKEAYTKEGQLEFFYLKEGTYYLRIIDDRNDNRRWDTGEFDSDQQPEDVFYYHEEIEVKAKWDVTRTWNPTQTPLNRQKPDKLVKTKATKEKKIQNRNAERAKKLGIEYIQGMGF